MEAQKVPSIRADPSLTSSSPRFPSEPLDSVHSRNLSSFTSTNQSREVREWRGVEWRGG